MEVLRIAAGEGRLTPDELDERLGAALSSRTLGELAVLTEDLVAGPSLLGVATAPATAPAAASALVPAEASAKDVIRIDQRGGSVRRTGHWVVPRRLELRSSWCDVWLDFTDAVITHDTLRIDLNMRGGSLVLAAGPGLVVEADSLIVRYADVKIRPTAEPGTPVVLRVQLVGRMRYGWIEQR